MYMLVWSASNGISLIGWLLVGFAFLIDMGSYGAGARGQRRYKPSKTEPTEVKNLNE